MRRPRHAGRRSAMAIDIKEPAVKAPWPPKEENDPLYRYPKPYPVGRAKGESFFTIAKKHHLGASDLVHYNFRTRNSSEINWYLANYVGCPTPKHGQRYYELAGASYDPVKNTGVIFIPMHGETTSQRSLPLRREARGELQQHHQQRAGRAVLRDLLQPGQGGRPCPRRHDPDLEQREHVQ